MNYFAALAPHWMLLEHKEKFRMLLCLPHKYSLQSSPTLGIRMTIHAGKEVRKIISKSRYRGIVQIRHTTSSFARYLAVLPGWETCRDRWIDGNSYTPTQLIKMLIDELGTAGLIHMSFTLQSAAKEAMKRYAFPNAYYAHAKGALTLPEDFELATPKRKKQFEEYAAQVLSLLKTQQKLKSLAERKNFPLPHFSKEVLVPPPR